MRRVLAIFGAAALVLSVVSSSAAAGPTSRVNHFVGDFDMLDWQGNVVATVVADFTEPGQTRLVPGRVDVYWRWYDPASQPFAFPFMPLDWPPVRESHGQLLGSWFMQDQSPDAGVVTIAGASGYLCDYTGPWNAGCRLFYVMFQTHTVGTPHYVLWGIGTSDAGDPNGIQADFQAGAGAFALTYAGPTGS